tara:strand:+ start:2772 stop:3692 length:921 start_codon:yes stop_codon:yes gene_type:complete
MISLSDITNQYGTYSGNSLRGELGSIGSVQNDGLEGITGVNFPYLSELIVKINGAAYTYSGYLNSLKLLGNPYISKSTIPTIDVTLASVTRQEPDVIVHGSTTRTRYAEVAVTGKLSTVNDVLRYLNDFFNPNTTDTVLVPQSIGSFRIFTTSYSADLDVSGMYPGLEFETFEDIGTATSVTISTPPTITQPKVAEPPVKVDAEPPKTLVVSKPPTPKPNPPSGGFFRGNSKKKLTDRIKFNDTKSGTSSTIPIQSGAFNLLTGIQPMGVFQGGVDSNAINAVNSFINAGLTPGSPEFNKRLLRGY